MTIELFRSGDTDGAQAHAPTFDFAKVMAGAPHLLKSESSRSRSNVPETLDFSDFSNFPKAEDRSLFYCADTKNPKETKDEKRKDPTEEKHEKSGYKAFLEGRYADAEKEYKSLLELNQKNYGKDSKEVARVYDMLGSACEKDKRYADAKTYYKQGAEVSAKANGKDHYETGLMLHSAAQMDAQLKNWKEAAASYKGAVDILASEKNAPSSDNGRMTEATKALKGYADALKQLGDKKSADEQLKRASEIEKNYLTPPNSGIIYF